MKNILATFLLSVAIAVPAHAEFLQMDISIFGMD